MRINPVSPSETSRPVSGEIICARHHGGKRKTGGQGEKETCGLVRLWTLDLGPWTPATRTYACELNSLMPYSVTMYSGAMPRCFVMSACNSALGTSRDWPL